MHWRIEQEKMKTLDHPSSMGENATDTEKEVFKVEVYEYVKFRNILKANLEKSYKLILGQCTDITRTKLKGLPDWEATNDTFNVIKLLKTIGSLPNQDTDQKYHLLSL